MATETEKTKEKRKAARKDAERNAVKEAPEQTPLPTIEEDVFGRKRWDRKKMTLYGFRPDGTDGQTVSVPFMDGDFRADVTVDANGGVTGKVWDTASDEEYLPVHIQARSGAFVGAVRQAYREVLETVAANCCFERWFSGEQSSAVADRVIAAFGSEIDFPFAGDRETGVFRCSENRKWYAIRMRIPKDRLKGETDAALADVLNVKVQPERIPELLKNAGFYPAYHMNAKYWISILLDGTVPDETVLDLLREGRELVRTGKGKQAKRQRSAGEKAWWIVPANPAYYDVEGAFRSQKELTWKQGRGIRPGDMVFIYLASPVSEIRYRCLVLETELPFSYEDEHVRMTHLMKIRLLQTYPAGTFTLPVLRDCGVRMLHGPRPVTPGLRDLLGKAEKRTDGV